MTDKLKRIEKRYQQARRMERLTATRLRRLVTALQGWQDEIVKCENVLHADVIGRLIAEEKTRYVVKRLTKPNTSIGTVWHSCLKLSAKLPTPKPST